MVALPAPVFADNLNLQKLMEQLEKRYQKKIGVAAINLGNQQSIEYRANELFPIQSTFKAFLVSYILKQSMTNPDLLKQRLKIKKADIVAWSPVTEQHIGNTMSVEELCRAAVSYSDNTATNLLLKISGGYQGLTAFIRRMGDSSFQIAHWEPSLNSNPESDKDTATPVSIRDDLVKILKTDLLGSTQRKQLLHWMKNNTTGAHHIRSGIAKNWIVADKTGAGNYAVANDIAIIWPPHCQPIVLAVYTHGYHKQDKANNQVFAELTRLVIKHFAATDTCLYNALQRAEN